MELLTAKSQGNHNGTEHLKWWVENAGYMSLICKSLKILWVKRLLNEEELQRKIIPLKYLENVGGKLVFLCNYNIKKLGLELPPVFIEILSAWSELKQTNPKSSKDIQNEILWNNRFILIDGKSVWWENVTVEEFGKL